MEPGLGFRGLGFRVLGRGGGGFWFRVYGFKLPRRRSRDVLATLNTRPSFMYVFGSQAPSV